MYSCEQSFPEDYHVFFKTSTGDLVKRSDANSAAPLSLPLPPYRLRITRSSPKSGSQGEGGGPDSVEVESYKPLYMGPYPDDQPLRNTVRSDSMHSFEGFLR